jgi:hypothetical protein
MHTHLLHPLVLLLALLASLLTASPSGGQASALSTVIGIDRPRLSVVEQASGCDAKHDLVGTLTADDTGTVINRSSSCTYMVGLAVYRMFDENIGSQQIADWETAQLEPGAHVELAVSLPDCIVQVDLFYGPVQFSLADAQYGKRILQAKKLRTGRTYCQQLAPTCSAYSANVADGRTEFVALDPRAQRVYRLGLGLDQVTVTGLALHPRTGVLYAITAGRAEQPSQLYRVDRGTGAVTLVGPLGLGLVHGLGFLKTDASLWTWADGHGLAQIDLVTGAATIRFTSTEAVSDIVWNADGTKLYAARGTSLWVYTPADGTFVQLVADLGLRPHGLDLRPDGLLIGVEQVHKKVSLFNYNPMTQEIGARIVVDSSYDRLEGLAWPIACGNPSTGGQKSLITAVEVSPTSICAGAEVQVTAMAVHPETPGGDVDITINNLHGSFQYLRFTGAPGARIIQVTASTAEGYIDQEQRSIEVRSCETPPPFLLLRTGPNRFHEHTVDFTIANADDFAGQNLRYRWEFGDGLTAETDVPYITHFYGDSLVADELSSTFQTMVTLERTSMQPVTARAVVSLWNPYALNRQRGFIQPPVQQTDVQLRPGNGALGGTYLLRNLEAAPVRLTSGQVEYQFCDPEREPAITSVPSTNIEIGAKQSVNLRLDVPTESVGSEVCDVALTLSGTSTPGLPVYTGVYFTVRRNPQFTQVVNDETRRALLNRIVSEGLVADPTRVTDEDIDRLVQEGKIVWPRPGGRTVGSPQVNGLTNAPAQVGEDCLPGDPAPRPGVTCQATGEWTVAPPHISNARKGDIVLSSACGLIGGLLRQVAPPMRWSHSGMMTRDYYDLRHNTSSTDRYEDYAEGIFHGTDGIRGDVLKYGWPGTITQSIDEAFNGEMFFDPESGKRYEIDGFSSNPARCDGDISVIYPTVVKPTPGADPSVRVRLRAAADAALGINGHYRFYSYSNAAIAEDRSFDAPADARWAVGTEGSVCSSFIWSALRRAGITLEGDQLEESDFLGGAEHDAGTLDGLYYYTEAERKAGATWLYQHMYNLAYEKAGWLGTLFFDAPDDLASQMTNCFASDLCGDSGKNSDAWQHPGPGRAVSPDNTLFWDSPAQGGVYGYSEPMVYRAGNYVQRYTWQPSAGVGGVTGTVRYLGQPVANASVSIEGLGLELFTNSNGVFRDDLVPAGRYGIVASAFIDGRFISTRSEVVVNPGVLTTIDLNLQPPPDYYRQVTVQGKMYVVDNEYFGDEEDDKDIFESRGLSPFNRRDQIVVPPFCVGAEVRVELTIDLRLESDNTTVVATGEAKLFEGTDCDTDDLDDRESFGVTVAAGTGQSVHLHLKNTEFQGGDTADIDFQVVNSRQATTASSLILPVGGALHVDEGALDLSFPTAAVTETTRLDYTRVYHSPHSPTVGQGIIRSFTLNAFRPDAPHVTSFAKPFTLEVRYSDAELAAYGVDESRLTLAYWDSTRWVPLSSCESCTHDPVANCIRVMINHLTEFALIGQHTNTVYLPLLAR